MPNTSERMLVPPASVGTLDGRPLGPELVGVEGLTVAFRHGHGAWRRVVDGVTMGLAPGEVVAVIGESGSGKTTVCRAMIGLLGGVARVEGTVYSSLGGRPRTAVESLRSSLGRSVGYMPQDALQSLNPAMTVSAQLAEVLGRVGGAPRRERSAGVTTALQRVGLTDAVRVAYPHQLSGGMRQRVVLAAALAGQPQVLIADEPTTAIDATLRQHLLEMLGTLCDEDGLAILIVTHDMSVAESVADRVVVMYGGKVVEVGAADRVLNAPAHPYSRALAAAALMRGERGALSTARGDGVGAAPPGSGCPFAPRCPMARERCAEEMPPWTRQGTSMVRCWAAPGSDEG